MGARGRSVLPTAANGLVEPGIADEVEDTLRGAGFGISRLDLERADNAALRAAVTSADVVAVSGGDPFRLLAAARQVRFGEALRNALAVGTVCLGYSAGAVLVGPTLESLLVTSPFSPPPGMELGGLALVDLLYCRTTTDPGDVSATTQRSGSSGAACLSSR
jgi:dipeptidase E